MTQIWRRLSLATEIDGLATDLDSSPRGKGLRGKRHQNTLVCYLMHPCNAKHCLQNAKNYKSPCKRNDNGLNGRDTK